MRKDAVLLPALSALGGILLALSFCYSFYAILHFRPPFEQILVVASKYVAMGAIYGLGAFLVARIFFGRTWVSRSRWEQWDLSLLILQAPPLGAYLMALLKWLGLEGGKPWHLAAERLIFPLLFISAAGFLTLLIPRPRPKRLLPTSSWGTTRKLSAFALFFGWFICLESIHWDWIDLSAFTVKFEKAAYQDPPAPPRVLIIGIDGATWHVMDPLIEEGRLPNLGSLKSRGSWGTLKSIKPMGSPTIWTTIATGKTPSRHGVKDFFQSRYSIRTPALWDILRLEKIRCGFYSWLNTWPPPEVEGFFIPGWLSRDDRTYPENLERICFNYFKWKYPSVHLEKYVNRLVNREAYDNDLYWMHVNIRKKGIYAGHLIERFCPALAAVVFYETDNASHKFWKYMEPEQFPDFDPDMDDRYGGAIKGIYEAVDQAIGEILGATVSNTAVVVVSDHGFEAEPSGVTRFIINPDSLLSALGIQEIAGWMTLGGSGLKIELLNSTKEAGNIAQDVWSSELIERIHSIRFADTHDALFKASHGPGDEVHARLLRHERVLSGSESLTSEMGEMEVRQILTPRNIHSHHHEDGIILLAGPGVRESHKIEGSSVLDVTPTVLYLMGLPVGEDMDGHVLADAIEGSHLEAHPVETVPTYDTLAPSGAAEAARGQKDPHVPPISESTMERMQELGYVE